MARSRVVWSDSAAEDAEAIAAFIGRDSRQYATAVVERFLEAASDLGELPLSGRMVPELGDESIREVLVYSWRLIYHVGENVVTVTTVLNQRQHFHPDGPHLR